MGLSKSQEEKLKQAEEAIDSGDLRTLQRLIESDKDVRSEVNQRNLDRLEALRKPLEEVMEREAKRAEMATKATSATNPVAKPIDPSNPASNPTSPLVAPKLADDINSKEQREADGKILKEVAKLSAAQKVLNAPAPTAPTIKKVTGAAADPNEFGYDPSKVSPRAKAAKKADVHVVTNEKSTKEAKPTPESATQEAKASPVADKETGAQREPKDPPLNFDGMSVAEVCREMEKRTNEVIARLPASAPVQAAREEARELNEKAMDNRQALSTTPVARPTVSQDEKDENEDAVDHHTEEEQEEAQEPAANDSDSADDTDNSAAASDQADDKFDGEVGGIAVKEAAKAAFGPVGGPVVDLFMKMFEEVTAVGKRLENTIPNTPRPQPPGGKGH